MTKILLVAALMTSASVAMASKSRVDSLQGSITVATDFQDTLREPARMFEVSDAFTLEYGGSQSATTTKGEAGLIRTSGDSKWGVYFGRQPTALTAVAGAAAVFGTAGDLHYFDNPLMVSYGMKGGAMSWGAGLYYASSSDKKTASGQYKKDVMSLNASLLGANWGAYLNLGLAGKISSLVTDASTDDKVLTSKSNTVIGGRYEMEDMSIGGEYAMSGGKFEGNGSDASVLIFDTEKSVLMVKVESKIKTDNAHFFYGAGLKNETDEDKKGDTKTDIMTVPLTMGIEAEAASWLTLRGAYSQALGLIDNTKTSAPTAAGEADKMGTSKHKLTAGAGWKFNKTHIDFNMTAGATGSLSATNFGSEASLTYWF